MRSYTKSQAAFTLAGRRLFELGKVYFWTFTFVEVPRHDDGAMEAFHRALNAISEFYCDAVTGLRVCEIHPGGHGLHFHALIHERLSIHIVRRICARYGFGRIGVEEATEGAIAYLLPYLAPQADGFGRRRWAAFGPWRAPQCRDIVRESPFDVLLNRFRRVAPLRGKRDFPLVNRLWRAHILMDQREVELIFNEYVLARYRLAFTPERPSYSMEESLLRRRNFSDLDGVLPEKARKIGLTKVWPKLTMVPRLERVCIGLLPDGKPNTAEPLPVKHQNEAQ